MMDASPITLNISIAGHSFAFDVGMAELWQFVGLIVSSYSFIALGAFFVGRFFGFKKGYEEGYKTGYNAKRIIKYDATRCPKFPNSNEIFDIRIAKDENNRVHSVYCSYMLNNKCLKDNSSCIYLS